MKNGIPKPDKAATNGSVAHENGSLEPKTTKTNGIQNGFVSSTTSKLANGSSGPRTMNGDDLSTNGVVDNSLVNVFLTNGLNGPSASNS